MWWRGVDGSGVFVHVVNSNEVGAGGLEDLGDATLLRGGVFGVTATMKSGGIHGDVVAAARALEALALVRVGGTVMGVVVVVECEWHSVQILCLEQKPVREKLVDFLFQPASPSSFASCHCHQGPAAHVLQDGRQTKLREDFDGQSCGVFLSATPQDPERKGCPRARASEFAPNIVGL